ncbi:Odorant receptor 65, partial [Frankliniella occidentalis]
LHVVLSAHVDLYTLLALQLDSVRACAVLNTCIGHRFQVEGGRRSTARSASLHAQVNESARLTSMQFGHLLPHFLTVGLVMPVVATAEVISSGGHADSFAIAMVPLLFVFFVSQCVGGQQLENSSEGLGWAAYQGPWLSEDARARRLRLLVIQSVTARPACFGVPGITVLNHATCQDALRIWFQYLQILLNTNGRRRHGPAQ